MQGWEKNFLTIGGLKIRGGDRDPRIRHQRFLGFEQGWSVVDHSESQADREGWNYLAWRYVVKSSY
jgi:hypothetical protein